MLITSVLTGFLFVGCRMDNVLFMDLDYQKLVLEPSKLYGRAASLGLIMWEGDKQCFYSVQLTKDQLKTLAEHINNREWMNA